MSTLVILILAIDCYSREADPIILSGVSSMELRALEHSPPPPATYSISIQTVVSRKYAHFKNMCTSLLCHIFLAEGHFISKISPPWPDNIEHAYVIPPDLFSTSKKFCETSGFEKSWFDGVYMLANTEISFWFALKV